MVNLDNVYTYHPPKDAQIEQFETVRKLARELAEYIDGVIPSSRELSLAHTKIEEAVMWANAGIARNT